MNTIAFGYWNGQTYSGDQIADFSFVNEFDKGEKVKAFIGDKGLLIFDRNVSLVGAFKNYLQHNMNDSCGRCTPCRVGLKILHDQFTKFVTTGRGTTQELDEVLKLADHIKSTSLCGLGQTATVALSVMLRHFRHEIENELTGKKSVRAEKGHGHMTTPCIEACPARVDVPRYIDYIRDGKTSHSVAVVLKKYPWAASCGRVCVRFCELACKRTNVDDPVGIKTLKRFVADKERYVKDDWFGRLEIKKKNPDMRVAVVGSGPAGVCAAYHLLLKGYHVDVYETHSEGGGMAKVGIPNYRLPAEILNQEISILERLGGKIVYGKRLGRDFTVGSLRTAGYKSIFLGVGAHKGKTLDIPGESLDLSGYAQGINFLLYVNNHVINNAEKMELGQKLVVIGGGNVAMDCVRSALRLGVKEVHLVYRRTKNEMPADHEEIEAAEKEGVIFHYLTHPTKVLVRDGRVSGLELIKMELTQGGVDQRRGVKIVAGSEFSFECDYVVAAIGQAVDTEIFNAEDGITLNKWGLIEANPVSLQTSRPDVFAGGDCVSGPATLIEALAHGERAGQTIDEYLTHGEVQFDSNLRMSQILKEFSKRDKEEIPVPILARRRVRVEELDPEYRKQQFEEVEQVISQAEAYREAERCLRCYRLSMVITE